MTRTHLLTGAGSGIGELLARDLLERGDDVLVVARSAQRAEEMAAALPGARPLVADLASPATVESLDLPARLDSVVHAAGVVELGAVADLSVQAWTEQLQVNLVAPAVLTRVALPALRAARGTVVLVNSGAGLFAHPQWSAYAASKHAVIGLTRTAAVESGRKNIRVNAICPYYTRTPMLEGGEGLASGGEAEQTLAMMAAGSPMKRIGEPEEIVAVMLMLLSPANTYMNGQAVAVDGGVSAF